MSGNLIDDLFRCEREIEQCVAYDGPDKIGALLGEMDNRVERELILGELWRQGIKPPTTAELAGSDPDFTGEMSTDEYIRKIRERGESR